MATIIQTADNTFTTDNGRGTTFTLVKSEVGYWMVIASNAATRAYRTLGAKTFWSLEEVEAKYKTFRGIAELVG